MKKLIVLTLFALISSVIAFTQIRVYQNGRIGFFTEEAPAAKIGINSLGVNDNYIDIIASGYGHGISLVRKGLSTNIPAQSWKIAFYTKSEVVGSIMAFGLRGVATPPNGTDYLGSGRATGVYGLAGGATNGYNYGVIGAITQPVSSNGNGTGILGIDNDNKFDTKIDGRYAGYFRGNVKVLEGTINGTIVQSSDIRYKQNIVELSSTLRTNKNITHQLIRLNPIEYELKQISSKTLDSNSEASFYKSEASVADTADISLSAIANGIEAKIYKKKHYGLIAQELQEIYPDLVYEEDNGYLAVNYVEIIPLLIQSVKELNTELERQSIEITSLQNARYNTQIADEAEEFSVVDKSVISAMLYQNIPNPFSQSTQIKYYLPESITSAYLCFYDLQGKQLKQIALKERGENSQIISGSEFSAGIYLYALIADGKEIDVKRMILTE